ncbi:MAG: bifunctional DNA primase/polymerase [Mycobacterium sp.]
MAEARSRRIYDRASLAERKATPMIPGYADASPIYDECGWPHNFPLPRGEKSPPPKGVTGQRAELPTAEQKRRWCSEQRDGNIGLYIPDGVLVADIDNYAKGDRPAGAGLVTIAAVEARAGRKFPPTWTLRNRTDGSEKRFYRVSKGRRWRSNLGPGVDLIHHGHRYVNAGINPTTGNPEQWYDPDGNPSEVPPRPEQLTELPEELVDEAMAPVGSEYGPLGSDSEARRVLADLPKGEMSASVRQRLEAAITDLSGLNGPRHDRTRMHVETLVLYGSWGSLGADTAIDELRTRFVEAVAADPSRGDTATVEAEFDRLVLRAGQVVAGKCEDALDREINLLMLTSLEPGGAWHPDTPKPWQGRGAGDPQPKRSVFKVLGPAEWAKTVPEPAFLIRGVLCADTFGVNAGPKKSLKTHDNQAIALSLATGRNLYLDERFPVKRTARVLYVVGEGGELPIRRTLRRMARAYGVSPNEIADDPDFPLVVAFGAAPMNARNFRSEFCGLLDEVQPDVILLESFYNFHPSDVEGGNLYQRGQAIDAFHKVVRRERDGAVSLITDHYRSTGTAKSLDLDSVAMAGQAENADSWLLRHHRSDPDVSAGEFYLQVGFNSRQWGGTVWNIDWHLGSFDHELGHHDGEIDWEVHPPDSAGAGADIPEHQTAQGRNRLILEYIDEHPDTSKTAACDVLAQRHGIGDKKFRTAWTELENARLLVQAEGTVKRPYGEGTREYKTKVWERGSANCGTIGKSGDE